MQDDLISRQAAIGCLRDGQICGDYCRRAIEQLPPAQPHVYRGVTLNDVMMYFDSLEGNEDAWTEFCSCFECRGWGLYHIRSATEKNVGTNDDCISRQAAIDAVHGRIRQIGYENYPHVLSIKQAIRDLPSAQPEIIHCGDCKYQDENWRRVSVRWLPCMEVRTGSNWYCGSAERRTDE